MEERRTREDEPGQSFSRRNEVVTQGCDVLPPGNQNRARFNDRRKIKPCFYFINYGHCRYGRDCKYFHPRSTASHLNNRVFVNSRYSKPNARFGRRAPLNLGDFTRNPKSNSVRASNVDQTQNIACQMKSSVTEVTNKIRTVSKNEIDIACTRLESFQLGSDENCTSKKIDNFSSIENAPGQEVEKDLSSRVKNDRPRVTFQSLRFRKLHDADKLSDVDLIKLRSSEIMYFEKRFPHHRVEENDTKYIATCSYLDATNLSGGACPSMLQVIFKEFYPKEVCEIQFLEQENVSKSEVEMLNTKIRDFLNERHEFYLKIGKFELVLSAFLKWLDMIFNDLCQKNLQLPNHLGEMEQNSVVGESPTDSSSQLIIKEKAESEFDSSNHADHSSQKSVIEVKRKESFHDEDDDDNDPKDNTNDQLPRNSPVNSSIKGGTEVRLLHFELLESAAALECSKIAVTVRCGRCKILCELLANAKQTWKSQCSKCHQANSAIFHPLLLHPFSDILGYLHLAGLHAIDLAMVQCKFQVTCLNCSKKCTIDGINFGRPHVTWCMFCNHKFSIAAQTVKFQEQSPSGTNNKTCQATTYSYESSKKKSRDPGFKEGKPLPNNGSCKHYKKSHRWLRFPCCGKSYACDICHEENEDGHEMKFASRMICGFCSKEQPYGKDKSCDSCSAVLTKKSGSHWEGGKGCRDRLSMSRDDKHKYTGASKTISRKSVTHSPKKKK